MKIPKDPKTTEIYMKNFNQLGEALMNSGGNPFHILKEHEDLLYTLAANKIKVTAKYIPFANLDSDQKLNEEEQQAYFLNSDRQLYRMVFEPIYTKKKNKEQTTEDK